MHTAAAACRRDIDHQAARRDQQAGRAMTGHVGGTQTHIEQPCHLQRLLPEGAGNGQRIGNRNRTIDQNVEPAMLAAHALEQRRHLDIIAMVTGHAMPWPPAAVTSAAVLPTVPGSGESPSFTLRPVT
jgi:hypothetical protein